VDLPALSIVSIEDGMAEEDWDGWPRTTNSTGASSWWVTTSS